MHDSCHAIAFVSFFVRESLLSQKKFDTHERHLYTYVYTRICMSVCIESYDSCVLSSLFFFFFRKRNNTNLCMYLSTCTYMKHTHTHTYIYIYTHTHTHIYMYVCMHACMHVWNVFFEHWINKPVTMIMTVRGVRDHDCDCDWTRDCDCDLWNNQAVTMTMAMTVTMTVTVTEHVTVTYE